MPTFILSTVTSTGQALASTETGYVTRDGAIITDQAAVTMAGTARITVLGELAAMRGTAVTLSEVSNGALMVGEGGIISASAAGNFAISGTFAAGFALRNAGQIMGGQGISMNTTTVGGKMFITNSGSIEAASNSLGNAIVSTLAVDAVLGLVNSGHILSSGTGAAILAKAAGRLEVANSGEILASAGQTAIFAENDLTLRNTGHIVGNVSAFGDADIRSSGVIEGSIFLSAGNDRVQISGTVQGSILLQDGTNTVDLRGGFVAGTIFGGVGSDTYIIDRSDVVIIEGGGLDSVTSSVSFRLASGIETLRLNGVGLVGVGTVAADTLSGGTDSTLRGLGGNDRLGLDAGGKAMGGQGNDVLFGGDGDEALLGGQGDDTIFGQMAGDDTVEGGAGADLLSFLGFTLQPVVVNLAAGQGSIAGSGTMQISGIENVHGSLGQDSLTGNAADNVLAGFDSNDVLAGGGGNDLLAGGTGSDTMSGGAGADRFVFNAVSESNGTTATDTILAFQLADEIDLAAIDAGVANHAFVFIGHDAFTGGAEGQVRYSVNGNTTLVEVRLAGSVADDMQILLNSAVVLTEAQFAL